MSAAPLVSIHGGHSGQFCSHAQDTLEEVVQAYIGKNYEWVGITEHIPPLADRFMYKEEAEAGFNPATLLERFDRYMAEGRRLQEKYADHLEIFIGFETEAYTGAFDFARQLMDQYQPDYVLGGIHHVGDIPFDSGKAEYQKAVAACGGIEALYCSYFDLQYEMMQIIRPQVVAHFDLIRIFDDRYLQRWQTPAILQRIERNLNGISQMGMILDYNTAAMRKGAAEPYLSYSILEMARDKGIAVVPGDDSHGVEMVGAFIEEGIAKLEKLGLARQWLKPLGNQKSQGDNEFL